MELKDKLLTLRKEKGLSQQQLADQLHVSRQSISKWELGESEPTLNNIIMLSEIFHVSTDYLLKENNESTSVQQSQQASTFLVIGTLINLLGTFIGYMLWQYYQNILSLLFGMSVQVMGCILFEYFALKEHDHAAQKLFFSINIWLFPLLSIKYFVEYTLTYQLLFHKFTQIININYLFIGVLNMFSPLILSLCLSAILFIVIRKVF